MSNLIFKDNIRVKKCQHGGEYLSVTIQRSSDESRFSYALCRYCVPGRVDIYWFDFDEKTNQIQFHSESDTIPAALKLLTSDLNKPQVIKMLVNLCGIYEARGLVEQLIGAVAPANKSIRAMRRQIKKIQKRNP